MGLVIRCMYNNRGWKEACERPGEDPECKPCFDPDPDVRIKGPKPGDKRCSGSCWERYICADSYYRWGCYPKGRAFARAYKGMKVFFVYKDLARSYTIWGTTRVVSIDSEPMQTSEPFEDGYKFIHFEPFQQLPRDKWVSGLSAKQLVGADWRQGRFRYITGEQETNLERLIEGIAPEKPAQSPVAVLTPGNVTLNIVITPTMYGRLESAATEDGRQIDEVVREAIAEWLRGRR